MLKFYNTLTRRRQDFVPIDKDNVRLYVCGPTVYDQAHIGNARAVVVFDLLYRLLRYVYGSDQVCYVRNITDVDDKINARAAQDFPNLPLNDAILRVTEKTAAQYAQDMDILHCLPPNHEPRATQYILPQVGNSTDMVTMINILLSKGHAYSGQGTKGREILFRVRSMENYGALSHRSLDEQQAGARIAVEPHKEDAGDFVLWKESTESEPGWDANFAGETIRGRPGWHIECSAMSTALLGEVFDIHGGGQDLIFPHHENEIAQSCCVHGISSMANIWMHNGLLQIEGRKMSKSLDNFLTVQDLVANKKMGGRNWSGDVIRLCLLMTSYREPLDFTLSRLEQCETLITKWRRQISLSSGEAEVPQEALAALGDDLDVASFFAHLSKASGASVKSSLSLLGIELSAKEASFDPQAEITRRLQLIEAKDWNEADCIRASLLSRGIQLKDGKDKSGNRITTWEVV